jgi:hypothetical protein
MSRRALVYIGIIATVVTITSLGIYLVDVGGLEAADKAASVVGAFVALVGLAVTIYGGLVNRKPARTIDLSEELPTSRAEIVLQRERVRIEGVLHRAAEEREGWASQITSALISMVFAILGAVVGIAANIVDFNAAAVAPVVIFTSLAILSILAVVLLVFLYTRRILRKRKELIRSYSLDQITDERLKMLMTRITVGQEEFNRAVLRPEKRGVIEA